MASKAELACVYSALILVDDDVAVTGEKISTILKAAGVDVEPYWPGLFAKALEGVNVRELISNIGSGVGAAPAAAPAAAAAAAPAEAKKEEKKEEEPEESDDDMGFDFGSGWVVGAILSFAKNLYIKIKYQQVRNKWANWMMIRDVKRRRLNAEHFLERTRINALRKNDVLPVEIREMADKDVNKFDLNACPLRINNRCVVTSRPRGIVKEWRMSRIVWRHLADYNKLSGVQRAMWG
ncbi:hypothetical protein MSG28_000586 [Choristoneura fumiferana]|uniref:Uncharacterized protein n=1 Tax=Choristoneura fumiferana TaxID=7141 RepID=A0ACC0K1C8_CHOFU|nr:hypothetical protein MSG28_000586 [Choristoneura fumiferana]